MGLRNWARKMTKTEAKHGAVGVPQMPVAEGADAPPHKFTVSQDSLDKLVMGREQLLQERQRLVQRMADIDAMVHQQQGGIELMQRLLEGQKTPQEAAVSPTGGVEVVGPVVADGTEHQ